MRFQASTNCGSAKANCGCGCSEATPSYGFVWNESETSKNVTYVVVGVTALLLASYAYQNMDFTDLRL